MGDLLTETYGMTRISWCRLDPNWYYPSGYMGAARFELATFTVSG
jgi:hypothetical protein